LNFFEEDNVYDFIKEVEYRALQCNEENSGINDSGAKLEINYIIQALTNRYIEFITYNNSNLNLIEARINFLIQMI